MNRTALIEAMARGICADSCTGCGSYDGHTHKCENGWQSCVVTATAALTAIESMGAVVVPREIDDETADGIWRVAYDEWAEFGALDRDAGRAALREVIAASPYVKEASDG